MAEYSFLTIPELGRLLRGGRVTSTELTEYFLDRLERLGPAYNAVVTLTRERALREAAQADRERKAPAIKGPLHGIPYAVKDLLAAEGAPTTWGAQPYRDQLLQTDSAVVNRLGRAGAILCAKLSMVELAGGMGYNQAFASFNGPGRSPWDPSRWSGGSSSGSGSAVGAGLVPFAIGTETWGSIAFPAAFCGVTGLRPTYGRVSRYGAMALCWSMDKIGPLARTAEDCGLVLSALAGRDASDPATLAGSFRFPAAASGRRRYRLGVLKGTVDKLQPGVERNFLAALDVLRGFSDVEEGLTLPDYPYNDMAGSIIDAEAASAFEELFTSGRITGLTAPEDRIGGYAGQVMLAKDYLRALRLRGPAADALDATLAGYDAIVGPTLPTVAWPIDTPFDKVYPEYPGGAAIDGAANLCGIPGLFVVNGLGEGGLPTSLQFTGRAGSEGVLLGVGMQFQARTTHHRLRPSGVG